jgi:hypothetical protein
MYQTREQDIDVSRAHQNPKSLIHLNFVRKIGTHVLAGDGKHREKKQAKN